MKKDELISKYIELGNKLPKLYPHLNLQNHCYWRIANDNACNYKWDLLVKKPFHKNASLILIQRAINNLEDMMLSPESVDIMNKISISYRKAFKLTKISNP